ncbi:MAG: class I SAM-dependent methyltransferase [Cyanobacteria bacterium P01_G01_bin.4]
MDSADAYERHARDFMRSRDRSQVGVQVVTQWARSLEPSSAVLEIACGGGLPVTQTLVDAGLRVWAIDSSPTLVAVFQQRFPHIPIQCARLQDSDCFQRKYDAAISVGLIFLLDEIDQFRMLDRISDRLRPGASFLFTAPFEVGTWIDISTGHTCVSLGRDVYECALARAGFRAIGRYEDQGGNNYYEAKKVADSMFA